MEKTTRKTTQKVQESNRGTLTPKTSQREESHSLSQSADESAVEDVFGRRPLVARSPVKTPLLSAAGTAVAPGEEDSTDGNKQTNANPFEAVVVLARQQEEEHLKTCFDTLAVMKAATNRQKNISQDVKDGIVKLEASLHHILQLRRSWQSCESVTAATQTTPSLRVRAQPAGAKRAATSPAQPEAEKKPRGDGPAESTDSEKWTDVVKRRGKRKKDPPQQPGSQPGAQDNKKKKAQKKKPRKQRPDALLIKPSEGKSYADVLGEIRSKAKPDEKGAIIKGLRKTRAGDLLVDLGDASKNKSAFSEDLQTILGANATVRVLEPKSTLEVRDLDELTSEAEVTAAVKSVLGDNVEVKTFLSKANTRGQKVAILTLGAKAAAKLLERGHLKVWYVSCRVREKLVAPRCFKCLGYGHVANRCPGPDRSKVCFKCGGQDHKASACSAALSCVLCTEAGLKGDQVKHSAGSGRCGQYRQAIQALRQAQEK